MTVINNVSRDWLYRVRDLLYEVANETGPLGAEANAIGTFLPDILATAQAAADGEPWQHIDSGDLDSAERLIKSGNWQRAAFFPIDAHTLANISLHCIREVRAARAALPAKAEGVAVPDGWRRMLERITDELDALNCAFRDEIDDDMAEPDEERERCDATDEMIDEARALLAAAPVPPVRSDAVTAASRDVLAERQRQVTAEGWTTEHDDGHACGEISALAAFYAMPPACREWDATSTGYGDNLGDAILPEGWVAKSNDDRRRELIKAGALILAEIERLDRAAQEIKP